MPFSIVESEPVSQDSDLLCGPCVTQQPPYRQNRSALVYDDSSRSLILAFKHGDKTHLTVTLAPLLARCGAEILGKADFLIPVPLHWRRLITRRYNQAGLLAHALGKLTGIPVLPDVLLRKRHTPPQGHKNARDRHANVKNAFMLNPIGADSIKGKTCVLIDDVFTTGATLEECTQVLVDSGAREVNLLTLARVVKSV